MILNFTILGERCSGTNFLMVAIQKNFGIPVTWDYGWKHFFGFNSYKDSENTLFIGIVRNGKDWLNSFYGTPHHVLHLRTDPKTFITREFWSLKGRELMEDRHIVTGKRYKNIFELRAVKGHFLVKTMHKKVKHYIFLRYEDLRDKYQETMQRFVEEFGLLPKALPFELVPSYKGKGREEKITRNPIQVYGDDVLEMFDREVEVDLGYMVPLK